MTELELDQIISKVLPVILTFVLGFLLKKGKAFTPANGEVLLRLVFYVSLPALVFVSILSARLSFGLIYLPITCIAVVLATLPLVTFMGRCLHLPNTSMGVFVVGPMIMNTTFTIPFFLTTFGQEALAMVSIFDVGSNLMIYTLIYGYANKYSGEKHSKSALRIILYSPVLYALLIGLILNMGHLALPVIPLNFLRILGEMTTPLVMISLGIYFNPAVVRVGATLAAILIRMVAGFIIALFLSFIFGIEGLSKTVVLVACSAPLGFTTLTFSAISGLDTEFAASCVSYSILIGLFTTPLLIFFLS